MTKLKYQKDNKGRSILGTEYGIQITRPWNDEMYAHNNKVAKQMKDAASAALEKAYKDDDEENVTLIARAINAYGYGSMMSIHDIYEDAVNGLDMTSDHWLDSNTWPELIEAGLVKQIPQLLIGFKK